MFQFLEVQWQKSAEKYELISPLGCEFLTKVPHFVSDMNVQFNSEFDEKISKDILLCSDR